MLKSNQRRGKLPKRSILTYWTNHTWNTILASFTKTLLFHLKSKGLTSVEATEGCGRSDPHLSQSLW